MKKKVQTKSPETPTTDATIRELETKINTLLQGHVVARSAEKAGKKANMTKKSQTTRPETPSAAPVSEVTALVPVQDVDAEAYEGALSQLIGARQALAAVKSLPELKQVRDMAEALGRYTKQRQYGLEIENDAAEIRLIAERRLGEMLKKMAMHGGERKSSSHRANLIKPPSLHALGIAKDQSSRWQKEAALPEDAFQAYVTKTKAKGEELTSAAVLREAKKYLPPPKPKAKTWSVEKDIDALYALWEKLSPHWEDQFDRVRIHSTLRALMKTIFPEETQTTRLKITPPFSDVPEEETA